ncbi:MAG: leucine--tRNA ligase [Deltaproteobacteria bacterium]|nr:leucine--tRNA ligase [Deltaproteobacteria bacterium]
MTKKYTPKDIEPKWQSYWEKERTFYTDHSSDKPKFYMLEMFPYPSGRLHMGHVRNYSIGDVVARYKKKCGFNVMHPFGWDAFGLPAENAAIERGIHPSTWTYSNIKDMRGQLQKLGLGYDWDKEIATCHPDYYKWEQLVFVRALEKGLVYRKKALVNWSEKMQTVLANEQVIDGCDYRYGLPVVQKELTQWFFKTTAYAEDLLEGINNELEGNWPDRVLLEQRARIGKSHGAQVDFKLETPVDDETLISVFTTRPDTLYGVTFMSLAPEHPMAQKLAKGTSEEKAVNDFIQKVLMEDKHKRGADDYEKEGVFTGKHCINPVNGDKIPVYIANFVLMDYGTGAVMAVPAHDQRDFEFAKKYDIPIKIVISPKDGTKLNPEDMTEAFTGAGFEVNSGEFDNVSNDEAKEAIASHLERTGVGGKTVNYRIRDWCVSRQRYWGAPIPIIYCEKCGAVPVPENQLPVLLPEDVEFKAEGGSPLARNEEFINTECPKCGGSARRETDTFDTFMESSWYQLRYASPRYEEAPLDGKEVEKWLPVDQYIGGIEHAVGHLMYSRFYHRLMQDLGFFPKTVSSEPFKKLLTQGMVCKEAKYTLDANGQPVWHSDDKIDDNNLSLINGEKVTTGRVEKMSKSKHNGVDPEKIMEQYGVDSARMFVLFASPPENDLVWKEEGVEGVHRYLSRVWNMVQTRKDDVAAAKTYSGNGEDLADDAAELWKLTHQTIKKVTGDIHDKFHFNTAIARCMELMNAISKFNHENIDVNKSVQKDAVASLVNLLSPFAPHVCEEMWTLIGEQGDVCNAPWPTFDERALKENTVTIALQVMGKLRGKMDVPADCSKQDLEKLALEHENVKKHIEGKTVRKIIVVPGKLVNIVAN